MFDYFIAGGLFGVYILATAIYQGVSCCVLTRRINILKNKLRRRGFVYTQGDLSTVEYYNWLYNIYYYYSLLDNLRKTSVVVERLFENTDELMVVINEVAKLDDRESLELSTQVLHDVLNGYITQCKPETCKPNACKPETNCSTDNDKNSRDLNNLVDEDEDSNSDEDDSAYNSDSDDDSIHQVPTSRVAVDLLLKVLNYKRD